MAQLYVKRADEIMDFKNITVDMTYINSIKNKIDTLLFDEFEIKTEDDIAWKEYFHARYNITVIDDEFEDKSILLMILKNIHTWHKIIEFPKANMSKNVVDLINLFEELQHEQTLVSHKGLMGLEERMNHNVHMVTKLRQEAFKLDPECCLEN